MIRFSLRCDLCHMVNSADASGPAGWHRDRSRLWAGRNTGPARRIAAGRLTVPGIEPADGVVKFVGSPSLVGVRADDAMYMLTHGGNDMMFATARYCPFLLMPGGNDHRRFVPS